MIRPLDMLRLMLGLVMLVSAITYFLPPLLPFIPTAEWHDPMTVRLLSAFDQSGLLAVAKFVQFIGGALLVIKRAVPFALAAIMSVNVCGAFIAVVIEGDALMAVLALAIVALGALLMFAYLPAYRGVLASGAMAEDETKDEHFERIFVSPGPGLSRVALLKAAIVLAASLAFYLWVVPFSNGTTGLVTLAFPSLIFLLTAMQSVGPRK